MIDKDLQAPDFYLQDQYEQWIKLTDYRGEKVCIIFFSSIASLDNQAFIINYAKLINEFNHFKINVIAICGDTSADLKATCNRLHIPFSILADTDHKIRQHYDVWNQKITFGEIRWITSRSSLLIDETGRIYKTYKRANIETNAADVLGFIQRNNEKAAWRKLSRRAKEKKKREQFRQNMIVEDSEQRPGLEDLIFFIEDYEKTK